VNIELHLIIMAPKWKSVDMKVVAPDKNVKSTISGEKSSAMSDHY